MLVDFERVVVEFKRHLGSKPHHGTNDLLAALARLEGECMVTEGLPEKALRLYGVVLSDDLLRPYLRDPRVAPGDGLDDPSALGAEATTSDQEDTHAGTDRRIAA